MYNSYKQRYEILAFVLLADLKQNKLLCDYVCVNLCVTSQNNVNMILHLIILTYWVFCSNSMSHLVALCHHSLMDGKVLLYN